MRILRSRLLAAAQEAADAEASDARRSQVRTVDRSERIRTYNFPENRISDHRTGYKAYNLDQVLDGDLAAGDRLVRRGRHGRPAGRARGVSGAAALRCARAAADRLREAGVPSPEHDAAELLAHVLGVVPRCPDAGRRALARAARGLRRAGGPARRAREPLQHLTGSAAFRYRRARGRPRRLRAAARDRAAGRVGGRPAPGARWLRGTEPVVVDLCTGSGAIARRWRHEVPRRAGARRRARPRRARLGGAQPRRHRASTCGSATWPRPSPSWTATVDVVICNPPYIPLEAWESVAPRSATTTPALALFSGDDGLDAIRVARASCGHAAAAGWTWWAPSTPTCRETRRRPCSRARAAGRDVRDHADLAGRPRFVTARLAR